MEKKKIITIVIAILALVFFLVVLVSVTKSKKTTTPENIVIPPTTQKTEPKTKVLGSNQVVITGQIVEVTDQGIILKTDSGELNLKVKADTKVTFSDSTKEQTPEAKSSAQVGKTAAVEYEKGTMEIKSIIIQ
jgi:hypothetical protein